MMAALKRNWLPTLVSALLIGGLGCLVDNVPVVLIASVIFAAVLIVLERNEK
jgi:hypothetical protein